MIAAAFVYALLQAAGAPETPPPAQDRFAFDAAHLEVLRDENMALLSGGVIISRGGARLTAERVRAFFASEETGESPEAAGGARVRLMEAEGGVRYFTGGEQVTGARARYDAVADVITFFDDVRITRGRDVLEGCRLTYEVRTGESRIEACERAEDGGRVRGVFFPDERETGEDDG